MIVSQWHCELPHLHCFQCLPLLFPLRLFPAPCCLVPLGLKTDTKRQPRPNIDWVSGPQPSPSARRKLPERPLLFRSYSEAHSWLLAMPRDRLREGGDRRGRRGCGECAYVIRGGDYNRRDNTVEKRPHKKPEAMTGKVVESEGGVRTSVSTLR